MQLWPFLLILISSVTHAWWNLLAKRAYNKDIFFGLSKISEILLFFLPFLWYWRRVGFDSRNWYFVVVGALLIFTYYLLLAQAYQRMELSVAYPIARSSTLFLPLLAFIFIGETIDAVGFVAIVLVIVGVLILPLASFRRADVVRVLAQLKQPGVIFALLTALAVAAYTLWDKVAVARIRPFLYYYSYSTLAALCFALLLTRFPRADIRHEWQQHRWSIIGVGVLDMATYTMALTALSLSKATYTGTLRQLSLAVGVFFGWHFLNERVPLPKLTGVALLIIGGTLILFAR